ncbi:MAG: glycerate kinase, partial [Propionibacteriaceae bacterium]|nr:glycerate kinase [Propionibacteriaceae bacterium]
MRVVIAPDSFKSTMTAVEAARAVAEGWAEVRPSDEVVLLPMADGGEGTLDAFAALPGAERVPVDVVDALGEPRRASFVLLGRSGAEGAFVA